MSNNAKAQPGTLYIIATPIGNLDDITRRAVHILSSVDLIAAEDPRTSRKLLHHLEINNPRLIGCNAQTEVQRIPEIIQLLSQNQSVAYISDAGTPGISDPSVRLVRATRNAGFAVVPIPGPSALTAALCAAGIPNERFYFHGFLPNKKGRQKTINHFKEMDCTVILYESVHRLEKTLRQLFDIMGDRFVVVARELSKQFETFEEGRLSTLLEPFEITLKGEFVILIAPENFHVD